MRDVAMGALRAGKKHDFVLLAMGAHNLNLVPSGSCSIEQGVHAATKRLDFKAAPSGICHSRPTDTHPRCHAITGAASCGPCRLWARARTCCRQSNTSWSTGPMTAYSVC